VGQIATSSNIVVVTTSAAGAELLLTLSITFMSSGSLLISAPAEFLNLKSRVS
jgi:hypothetical protein